MDHSKNLASENSEPYVVSNVLRVHVPYTPLRQLDRLGVIESNEQIVRNESGQGGRKFPRKGDWEWRILLFTTSCVAVYKLVSTLFR